MSFFSVIVMFFPGKFSLNSNAVLSLFFSEIVTCSLQSIMAYNHADRLFIMYTEKILFMWL